MYPRIPWELDADPLGSEEHTLGTTGLAPFRRFVFPCFVFKPPVSSVFRKSVTNCHILSSAWNVLLELLNANQRKLLCNNMLIRAVLSVSTPLARCGVYVRSSSSSIALYHPRVYIRGVSVALIGGGRAVYCWRRLLPASSAPIGTPFKVPI